MKTALISFVTALAVSLLCTTAMSQPFPPGPPGGFPPTPPGTMITGGGVAENNNSGLGELHAIGGFVAQDRGAVATGQIQARTFLASDPTQTLSVLHGRVVCILNLGDGSGVGGTNADVWEIRFQVNRSAGEFAVPVGSFGSIFVQDNGTPGAGNDLVDESFANLGVPGCGVDGPFGLEPVLAGDFTVLD